MKKLTICICLLSAILLGSCGDKGGGSNEPEPNNSYTATLVGRNIKLERFDVNTLNDNTYEPLQFEDEELNKLKVIRNESEYKRLFKNGTYVESGIDFDTYTLLLVPVYSDYRITGRISQTLRYADNNKYTYSINVNTGIWSVVSKKICAALAPVISKDQYVSFVLKTTKINK